MAEVVAEEKIPVDRIYKLGGMPILGPLIFIIKGRSTSRQWQILGKNAISGYT